MPTDTANTPPPPPTPHQEHPGNRFFDWMRGLGIVRQPGWIGGVCAGVAARLGIDVIIVRGIVVVLAIFGGPALLLYAAAWLLLPDVDDNIHLERLFHGEFTPPVIGVGVLFLLGLLPVGGFWSAGPALWFNPGAWDAGFWGGPGHIVWLLAIIAAIVWFVVWASRRSRGTDAWPPTGAPTTPPAAASAHSPAAQTEADATTVLPPNGPTPPPAPEGAGPDDLAAWKVQQADWKREHDAWKTQQAASERALARQRADEQRRIRQEHNEERRQEWVERNRRTRSNPLFTLIAVGIALVAGAAVALSLAGGSWTLTAAITGMAVTLAVLGVAIVINGFRGKRSGGASGVAVLVTIALVLSSLFSWVSGPVTQNRSLDWSPSYSGEDWNQRTVVNGDATLDLTDYFAGPASDNGDHDNGRVRLVVVNGDVDVTVPADEFSEVRANSVNGSITTGADATRRGPFASADVSFTPRDATAPMRRDVFVQVWALNGDVTISQASR
jgi:phage shock protein PspC (stress-responsive transcriptional regulator)